jgi:restriction system protein
MGYIVINSSLPKDWRDLQIQVEKIMKESGLIAESEKDIETVRGIVNIDVYAEDASQRPKTIYVNANFGKKQFLNQLYILFALW